MIISLPLSLARIAAGVLLCLPVWAAWTPLGPFGGSSSVVVADPRFSKVLLAGTRNALLFRSQDGGESWTPLPFPAKLHATLNALAIDARGAYLAALSSDLPQFSGILRSTDLGATWRQIADLRNQQVLAIAFKRANPKIVAAGTDTGVYLSEDGGTTFQRISPVDHNQLLPVASLAFDPNDSDTLYAGTPHLPWKTSDGGATWHSIHRGMLDDSDVFSIQPDRNRPQRVFASACSGIYRSMNGGESWEKLVSAKDASYRTYVIAQDPQYENVWFAGTTHGMVRSLNGGATWEKVSPFATRSIAFDPGRLGRIFIATDQQGILRSDDSGTTWKPANRGFSNRRLSSVWTAAGGVYTIASDSAGNQHTFRLPAGLNEWEPVVTDSVAAPRRPLPLRPGSYLSADTARKWLPSVPPLSQSGVRAFLALDTSWLAATGPGGIFLSKDARVWIACSSAVGDVYEVISTSANRLLAATAAGLKTSDDLGRSWSPVAGDFGSDTVQAICRHPLKTRELFAATFGIVYASQDAGRSWTRIADQPEDPGRLRHLFIVPGSPDRLFVLTEQQGLWALPLEPR